MADNSSVIIDVSLNASAMESAINQLVADVDNKMKELADRVNTNVSKIEQSFNRLTTSNQVGNQSQTIKEVANSYDALAQGVRNAANANNDSINIIRQYDEQLSRLKQQLVKVRQDIDLYYQAIGSGKPSQIAFGQAGLREAEQSAERLMTAISKLEGQRRNLIGMIAPGPDLFKSYIDSLTKANPELAALNAQYRQGTTLLGQQVELSKQSTIETQRQVELRRQLSEATRTTNQGTTYVGPLRPETPEETQKRLELERQEFEAIEAARRATAERAQAEGQLNQAMQQRPKQQAQTFSTYEDLRQAIAHVLNVQTQEVQLANAETASYKKLSATLAQLKQAYSSLTASERNSENGKVLATSIHEVERGLQKIKAQMSRPVSLREALGNPEKTLDDIIYKMQQLSSYRLNINIGDKGVPKEIQDVNNELARLEQRKKTLLGQNEQVKNSNNALTRSFNYMKNRLAFYFTVGASTQFVKQLIEIRAQYELLEKSIGILVGSMQEGSRIFAELNAMAIKSPFTTMELGAAAKQLSAYDVAAKDVVNTTKRLADMAAAVGVPIQRLTYALGQVKAYDYLNARDARMFAQAGIPLVKELAQYYSELEGKMVSTADIYDRMKKHMISYNDTMAVVNKMTDEGGKFFNYQEKMAGTLKVQLANLTLAWNNMLNAIGKDNQSIITFPIKALKTLFKEWTSISRALQTVAIAFGVVKVLQIAWAVSAAKGSAATAVATATNWKFVDSLVAMRAGFMNLISSPVTWFTLLATAIFSVMYSIEDANEAIKRFNTSIRDSAKENVENISKFLDDYSKVRDKLNKSELSETEASKAWDAVKEEIEMASGASDTFISKLLSIENINERLSAGFSYLEKIKQVSAALDDIGKNTIKIEKNEGGWFDKVAGTGAVQTKLSGLTQNVQTYTEQLADARKEMEATGKTLEEFPNRAIRTLKSLESNLDDTYDSLMNLIDTKNWTGDPEAITELFGRVGNQIIQEGLESGWEPDAVFNFQMQWEEYRSKATKEATKKRYEMEVNAAYNAEDEKTAIYQRSLAERDKAQLDAWDETNGKGRIIWAKFCKWMDEEHNTRVVQMYNEMSNHGEKSIDYSSKKWQDFVNEMADKFAKENKMSHDEAFNYLKEWVKRANLWDIFIKLTISTGDSKSLYDTLTDYDKQADDAYGKTKRLGDYIKDLDKKIAKAEKGHDYGLLNELVDKRTKALKDQTTAQTEFNNAIEKGGKSKSAESDANKAAAAANKKANKEATAARRAQAKAESELAKALKDELQLIDKVRSSYKELTKAGASRAEALDLSTSGFEKSINAINAVLNKKWGLEALDIKKFAGISNPRELMTMLENQLNDLIATGRAKASEIQELQVKIKDLKVEAEKYDLEAITKGLNNELDKIKEEYELAVALEANPELGGIFADMLGISQDELNQLPKDWKEMLDRLQAEINRKVSGFDLSENLNKENFIEWVKSMGLEMDSELVKTLDKIRETVNKERQDQTKKILDDWNKLLEKYGEYEAKRTAIAKQAEQERAIARKNNASKAIMNAINQKEQQSYAKLDFEEFQKSTTWITATGNLSNLTEKALDLLIQRINEYKKQAKNLEPKEIMKLNKALRQLRKEQMRNNPFKIYAIAVEEAKERVEEYDAQIAELQQRIDDLGLVAKRKEGIVITEEEKELLQKLLDEMAKLKKEKEEVSKVPIEKKADQVKQYVDLFKQFSDAFQNFANSTSSYEMKQVAKAISDVVDVIQGALAGASSGGWIGAIVGGLTTAIPKILDWASGNDAINHSIEQSQVVVKRLTNYYNELEAAAQDYYGAEAYGAQKALILNKQMQLEELKRQLRFEKSRKKKYQDQAAIADLEGQIIDLQNEINSATNDIVNDLLAISSKGDFAENLVKDMISAFKQGEDYMKVFEESFESMVDNMIMKAIVSRLVGDWINSIWDMVDEKVRTSQRVQDAERKLTEAENQLEGFERLAQESPTYTNLQLRDMWRRKYEEALAEYNAAITPTPEDIAGMRDFFEQGRDEFKNNFLAYMDAFGIKFGESAGAADLSALQQGIQGITEDTAGALEAYMNGVSQQVYLHSDLLTQIRDILVNFGGDVTIATNAQILLQLQQSYAIQMAIQSILMGWSAPSGLAVRVEMQ